MTRAHRLLGFAIVGVIGAACSSGAGGANGGDGGGSSSSGDASSPIGGGDASTDARTSATGAGVRVAVAQVKAPSGPSTLDLAVPPTFSHATSYAAGWINSGPPDYVKVTLKRVELVREGDKSDTLWEGSLEVTLDGGPVDVSAINAQARSVAAGKVLAVRTTFADKGAMKGTLTGPFNVTSNTLTASTQTFHTKADAAYDPATGTGGADAYAHFQSEPSEEVAVSLGGGGGGKQNGEPEFFVDTPSDRTLVDGDTATLTILFDTSRMLRFYDGMNPDLGHGGVNPSDPSDKAYFFAHSLLGTFTASFVGEPGKIEGYETYFSAMHGDHAEGVRGWMTIVYGPNDEPLLGMLMGDDDNALTVAKGRISRMSLEGPADAGAPDAASDAGDVDAGETEAGEADAGPAAPKTYTLQYDIAQGTITGFERATSAGWYTPLAAFTCTNGSGEAYFRLGFTTAP